MSLKLLIVFAHPDDESFGTGGTIAKYASEGVDVHLICATKGEVGLTGGVTTQEKLGEVREKELLCAAKVLGIRDVRFLGYIDGSLEKESENEVIEKIVKITREIRPQVIVTFEPYGIYGHPDHKTISKYTKKAFEAVREEGFVHKMYYQGIPASYLERFSNDFNPDLEFRAMKDEKITTVIDVTDFVDKKAEALQCHRTQKEVTKILLQRIGKSESHEEHFSLAGVGPKMGNYFEYAHANKETDLFSGIE